MIFLKLSKNVKIEIEKLGNEKKHRSESPVVFFLFFTLFILTLPFEAKSVHSKVLREALDQGSALRPRIHGMLNKNQENMGFENFGEASDYARKTSGQPVVKFGESCNTILSIPTLSEELLSLSKKQGFESSSTPLASRPLSRLQEFFFYSDFSERFLKDLEETSEELPLFVDLLKKEGGGAFTLTLSERVWKKFYLDVVEWEEAGFVLSYKALLSVSKTFIHHILFAMEEGRSLYEGDESFVQYLGYGLKEHSDPLDLFDAVVIPIHLFLKGHFDRLSSTSRFTALSGPTRNESFLDMLDQNYYQELMRSLPGLDSELLELVEEEFSSFDALLSNEFLPRNF